MAKKQKTRERIAIFYNRYTDVIVAAPQVHCNYMKCYSAGEILWDESEIERLQKAGAPIGIYYKEDDVN